MVKNFDILWYNIKKSSESSDNEGETLKIENYDAAIICSNTKRLRSAFGDTQKSFGKRAGISVATVHRLENGKFKDPPTSLRHLAKLAKCTLNCFITQELSQKKLDLISVGHNKKFTRKRIVAICLMALLLAGLIYEVTPGESAHNDVDVLGAQYVLDTEFIVYVTPSGQKFHKQDCCHIADRTTMELSADEALSLGYGYCRTCFTPEELDL